MSVANVTELYKGVSDDDRERIFGPAFYGDFLNWGYWKWETDNHVVACEDLVDLVLSLAPRSGDSVLEAGCGVGGVSKRLMRDYRRVTGINVVADQIERCRQLVPGATFQLMDATALAFEPESFDDVVSIEAAMHFDTREQFLNEASRVLRPGGRLLVADIIGAPQLARSAITSVEDYANALEAAGLVEARVIDVTRETSIAHADYCLWFAHDALRRGVIDQAKFDRAVVGVVARLAATKYYVVATARKPTASKPTWRSEPHAAHHMSSLLTATAIL